MTTITGKENIDTFRMISLKGALKLEILGMKRRGQAAYAIVKLEYGLKGNKQKVYDQLCVLVERAKGGNNV